MKLSLAWAVVAMAGTAAACGPESNPQGGTGGTGGTTGGASGAGGATGGSMSGTGGTTGGAAGSGTGGKAGSGAGGTAGAGGAGGTAGAGASGGPHGFVRYGSLYHYPSHGQTSPFLQAQFERRVPVTTGTVCQRTEVGACAVTDCRVLAEPPPQEPPVPDPLPAPTAGLITIRAGDAFTADLTPDGKSAYVQSGVTGSLKGEESVTVTAAGAEVPAFTHTMTYPLLMLLTQPAFDDVQREYAVSRADDLVLTWDRGTPSLEFQVQAQSSTATLLCSFPGQDGTGTISSELLSSLDQGAQLILLGVQTETLDAGEFDVSVSSVGVVVTPDRTRRAKLVLE